MGRAGAQWGIGPLPGSPGIQQVAFPGKESLPLPSHSCMDMVGDSTLREPEAGYPLSVQPQRTGSSWAAGKAPASTLGLGGEVEKAWGVGREGMADPALPLLLHPGQGPQPLPDHPQHWASGCLGGLSSQPGLPGPCQSPLE